MRWPRRFRSTPGIDRSTVVGAGVAGDFVCTWGIKGAAVIAAHVVMGVLVDAGVIFALDVVDTVVFDDTRLSALFEMCRLLGVALGARCGNGAGWIGV